MTTNEHKLLAIAVASGKIGYVFIINGKLMDWGLSKQASATPGMAKCRVLDWLDFYRPDVVVTEKQHRFSRKSEMTHSVIEGVTMAVKNKGVHLVEVERERLHKNKYEEIDALAVQFPNLAGWAPHKRRAWESEMRETILFDALAMAIQYREQPANLPV